MYNHSKRIGKQEYIQNRNDSGREEIMKITCLMENTIGNKLCMSEHGLSLLVEMKDTTVLIDTGASGLFLENAGKLGIDLGNVEIVFLSHGHYDHGGGILDFSEINPTAKIVMQKSALGDYWHKSEQVEKYIGLDSRIRELNNLVLAEGDFEYCKDNLNYYLKGENSDSNVKINSTCEKKENIHGFTLNNTIQKELKCWPEGNLVLKEKSGDEYIQDRFVHEQYIVVREDGKTVLISGCAHNGILNILEEYQHRYGENPDVIISGFHMRKKTGYTGKDYDVIKETAEILKETKILCYTGHCTGEEPYQLMKEIMGEQLQYVHCGDVITV